jgi:metallo-beta-lactamase family protein
MKLHFLGANRQVTGSRYCLEVNGHEIMIDCGMFQERNFQARNWDSCPIPPAEIDALLLTHVHIDHSGLIPRLGREGFHSPIYCTRPSVPLLDVMLRDAAKIQTEDAEYKKKRHAREHRHGKHVEVPLFTEEDVDRILPLVRGVAYSKPIAVVPGVTATFHDAGHILGSAMIELAVEQGSETRRLVFSGDIGQWDKPIIRDPTLLTRADYLIMESTYGDRNHQEAGDIETQLERVIHETYARGGAVVIPTFALERAQELVYFLSRLAHAGRIPTLPVYLDSPMAVDVTKIFQRFRDSFDEEMWELINSSTPPLDFPGLQLVRTAEESKRINEVRQPCVIMASSGMCNAGRIKHHLRNHISSKASTILFVGHQSEGTLGRLILNGAREVRIHGQSFRVAAQIAQIYGFSGHADRNGLLKWIGAFQQPPRKTFFTHGEEAVSLHFATHVERTLGWPTYVPQYRETVDLD